MEGTEWCIISVHSHSVSYGMFGGNMLVPVCLCIFYRPTLPSALRYVKQLETFVKDQEGTCPVLSKQDHRRHKTKLREAFGISRKFNPDAYL